MDAGCDLAGTFQLAHERWKVAAAPNQPEPAGVDRRFLVLLAQELIDQLLEVGHRNAPSNVPGAAKHDRSRQLVGGWPFYAGSASVRLSGLLPRNRSLAESGDGCGYSVTMWHCQSARQSTLGFDSPALTWLGTRALPTLKLGDRVRHDILLGRQTFKSEVLVDLRPR